MANVTGLVVWRRRHYEVSILITASASVIYGLETYGFCEQGTALNFIQDGRIELDGELPLNTFGGSLGTGRIHGLWHIIEGACRPRGAPVRARSRKPMLRLSAPAPRS